MQNRIPYLVFSPVELEVWELGSVGTVVELDSESEIGCCAVCAEKKRERRVKISSFTESKALHESRSFNACFS